MQLKPAVKKILSVGLSFFIIGAFIVLILKVANGENAQTQEIISVKQSVAGIETKLNQPTATPEATIVPTKALLKSFKAVVPTK